MAPIIEEEKTAEKQSRPQSHYNVQGQVVIRDLLAGRVRLPNHNTRNYQSQDRPVPVAELNDSNTMSHAITQDIEMPNKLSQDSEANYKNQSVSNFFMPKNKSCLIKSNSQMQRPQSSAA